MTFPFRSAWSTIPSVRERLSAFINHRVTDAVVVSLIVLSVALLVVEILLPEEHALFEPVETAGHLLTGLFAVELLLRFLALPSRRRFLRLYWLDVLAVLPVLRPFRLVRVLRLLRLLRLGAIFHRRASGLSGSLRSARLELLALLMLVLMVVLAGAIGINLAERHHAGVFGSITESIWWSMYSLVAGEPIPEVPVTSAGRAVALLVMLCGLGFFAAFTGIVSAAMVTRLRGRMEEREMLLDEVTDHLVVCGWNRMGYQLLEQLEADTELRRRCVVLITEAENPPQPLPFPQERFFHLSGDFTRVDVLEQAGIERAAMAILLADKTIPRGDQDRDARTVLAALTIEKLHRGIFTCVELLRRENQGHLTLAGVEEIIVPDEYAGKILATTTRSRAMLHLLDELLTTERGNNLYQAALPSDWAGKDVAFVHRQMKERFQAVLLGLERSEVEGGRCQVLANPPAAETLRASDKLLFVATRMPAELAGGKHSR